MCPECGDWVPENDEDAKDRPYCSTDCVIQAHRKRVLERELEGASPELRRELTALLNRHSCESGSGTPDFILADYLLGCMEVFDRCVDARGVWRRVGGPVERKGIALAGWAVES